MEAFMDLIEKSVNLVKRNYSPPIVAGNEQAIKNDLIVLFVCMLGDTLAVLQKECDDANKIKEIQTILHVLQNNS